MRMRRGSAITTRQGFGYAMSVDHGTSERVYGALKSDLLTGRFPPGRLQVSTLQAQYASSATPVREALLRLVGEQLVEMRPTGGFGVEAMSMSRAHELYNLSLQLSRVATSWPGSSRECSQVEEHQDVPTIRLFASIDGVLLSLAQHTGNV